TCASVIGSHQAVLEMYDFLVKHCGYKSADVLILSDRQSKQQLYPTRNTIIKACEWLLKEAAPGDSFVFYYAGRSSMVPDHNNEQVNNMCTALVPMDHNVAGLLISSDMNTLLVQPIPLGARLLILNDITTPGSICALPNIYKTDG
ncbi:peptidase C14, caspase domain-containing protein, partial [Syncephalis plumigaleata]